MLKEIFDYGKSLLFLVQETQRNTADIKDIREELNRLTRVVDRLVSESELRHEIMIRDYRELVLRLELTLERFERRLPPTDGWG
jgi:hypothetical protein